MSTTTPSAARRPGRASRIHPGTPIRCRVCLEKMGVIPGFDGQVFMLCEACEEEIRRRKRAGGGSNQRPFLKP